MVIGEVTMGVFYLASYLNCCSVLQSILKNVDIHLNRAQAGRSRLTACVRGFLWTTSQISIFAILLFIFESHSALLIFKILIFICNVSPLSRTQTSSRKHSEVLELIILWALVIWFVCSAPRGFIMNRESTKLTSNLVSDGWRIGLTAGLTPQSCTFYNYHPPLKVVWRVKVWKFYLFLSFNCLS